VERPLLYTDSVSDVRSPTPQNSQPMPQQPIHHRNQCTVQTRRYFLPTIVLLLCSSYARAEPLWGSTPVAEEYRPTNDWLAQFPPAPHIVATGSIQKAVDQCDDVAGPNRHCVISLVATSRFPVHLGRSHTKLVATPGTRLHRGPVSGPWVEISNQSRLRLNQIIIEGLSIAGPDAGNSEVTAISIHGKNIQQVALLNNTISQFKSHQNAHAIAVYGTGQQESEAISGVLIDGNDVYDMQTGASESIVVNGNVTRWAISNNRIRNINNIAIDAIGGEGTSPPTTVNGRTYPGKYDQARYGFIENNVVTGMSVDDNPAYQDTDSWVAAIYIDGGAHINVTNNIVKNSDWAYEVGAENCVETRHITLTGNSASGSSHGDFLIGGWNTGGYREPGFQQNCNPHSSSDGNEGHGYVSHVSATKNRFESAPATLKINRILAQYRVSNTVIEDDNFAPVNADSNDGRASGDDNAIRNAP